MSPRELAILILGLAIIAVVLRGLYVAMHGRRGQIRLAIDKNIPRDVDLNALELAELPSGGARVVARSLAEVNRQNHAVATASAKAAKMNLGERKATAAPIPVLMDPVTLNKEKAAPTQGRSGPVAAIPVVPSTAEEVAVSVAGAVGRDHNTAAVAAKKSSQATADYPDDDEDYDEDDFEDDYEEYEDDLDEDEDEAEFEDEEFDDSEDEDDEFADEEDEEVEDEEDFEDDDDFDEDEYDPLEEDEDDLIDTDIDDDLGYVDDDADKFSMTAGDRIGFSPVNTRPAQQTSLFNDDEVEMAKPGPATKRKPLFAAFARKPNPAEIPVKEASPSISAKPTNPAPPGPVVANKPILTEKPQVIVAKPKPARVAPVRESLKTKEAVVEPVYDKAAAEPSEVVVLNVMAKSGRLFAGDDLLHVLITSGMKFGDMNIFHRRLGGDSKGPVIFSIANILNPGTFDLNRMHEFTTVGVSLFLAMPTSIKNLEAFEQMLGVAQQICSSLDGDLRDDNRNLMTAQTIEHYRQRIRDFELRRLKSVGARG